MLNYPRIFFLFSLLVLWLAAQIGAYLRRRRPLKDDEREDFALVQTATLTLLGLIIGFSFAMATGRYDLRKNYEEAEANAIGTEYVRAGLLPAGDGAEVRAELRKYLDLRILFYQARNAGTASADQCCYRSIAGGNVVCGTGSSRGATDTRDGTRRCGHERCAEFAGIHPGGMVEPYSHVGLGFNDIDRRLLQPVGRLWCA